MLGRMARAWWRKATPLLGIGWMIAALIAASHAAIAAALVFLLIALAHGMWGLLGAARSRQR